MNVEEATAVSTTQAGTELQAQVRKEDGTIDYLPYDNPDFEFDPYPFYDIARREVPVYQDETGAYVILRFDDVVEFGPDPRMSVEPGWDQAGPWKIAMHTIIGRDEPDHMRLRRQTNKWFGPKMVKDWVTTTAGVTNELLDAMEGDTIDGWHDLSVIPTHRTMCRVLQVPDDDSERTKLAMERAMPMLSARPRSGTREMAQESFDLLSDVTNELREHKREDPGDGLFDSLAAAHVRGEISEEEMHSTQLMFYALGHMDVGYIVAAGLYIFTQHPEAFEEFKNNPEKRGAIINEIVRLDPAELSFYRTNLEPVTIRGVEIPAGSTLRFMVGSANRDPEVFDNPHDFNADRPVEQSQHLSFGIGPHGCAGQVLSRAEARAVYEQLAARYSRIELAEPVVMRNNDFSRHFTKLKLRLVP